MKQFTIALWGKNGAGKTNTAINLGTLIAEQGHSVLLLSTDIETPSLQKYFAVNINNGKGIKAVLAGTPILSAAVPTKIKNMFILGIEDTVTALDHSSVSLADADKLMGEAEREFDYVIFDCENGTTNPLALIGVAYSDLCIVLYSSDLQGLTWINAYRELIASLRPGCATSFVLCKDTNQIDASRFESLTGVAPALSIPYVPMGEIENTGVPLGIKHNPLNKRHRRYLQSINLLYKHIETKLGGEGSE